MLYSFFVFYRDSRNRFRQVEVNIHLLRYSPQVRCLAQPPRMPCRPLLQSDRRSLHRLVLLPTLVCPHLPSKARLPTVNTKNKNFSDPRFRNSLGDVCLTSSLAGFAPSSRLSLSASVPSSALVCSKDPSNETF